MRIYDDLVHDFGHRPPQQEDPVTDPSAQAVPTDASRAATDATESVRAELNAMFDAYQAYTGSFRGLDPDAQVRVRAWLKDHLDL
jgi:hypothetical protein